MAQTQTAEAAAAMRPPHFRTYAEALAYAAAMMPGEDRAGTIVASVAWELWSNRPEDSD